MKLLAGTSVARSHHVRESIIPQIARDVITAFLALLRLEAALISMRAFARARVKPKKTQPRTQPRTQDERSSREDERR